MKAIIYVLAITVFFVLIPLNVHSAPIDLGVSSDANPIDLEIFTVADTSLPYQFSVSTTPGFKVSFTLYKDGNSMFTFNDIEEIELQMTLDQGEYQAVLLSSAANTSGHGFVIGSEASTSSSLVLFGTILIGLIGLSRRQKKTSHSSPFNSSTKESDRTALMAG